VLGRKSLEEHGLRESDTTQLCFIYDYPSLEKDTANDRNRKKCEIYRSLGEHFDIPGEFIFLKKLGESSLDDQYDDQAVNFASMLHQIDA
jgi:hypothetical protein